MFEIHDARERKDLFKSVQPIARIDGITAAAVQHRVGFAPFIDEVYPGLGAMWQCWGCELNGFFGFSLMLGMEGDDSEQLHIFADRADRLSLILAALGIEPERVAWRRDRTSASQCDWEVVRQDDNGNVFALDCFIDRQDAQNCAAFWEKLFGDHKQSCFVRPTGRD